MYSANCKVGCKVLPRDWLSATDHCQWREVFCNDSREVSKLMMRYRGLSEEFKLFGMKSLKSIDLSHNNLSGTFTVLGASPNLTYLASSYNKLTGFVGGMILTQLESLRLFKNEFVGDFIVEKENIPTSINDIELSGNKLTGFVGGGILTDLEYLRLSDNEFVGDFIVNETNFPASIKFLRLDLNKLTGFMGGGILTNLDFLILSGNEFVGDFFITEQNFPTSISRLYLGENKLRGFVGGGILTNLENLYLAANEFVGDFIITAENFPDSITHLNVRNNAGLTSINAETGVLSQLEFLDVTNFNGITVNQELCDRRPGLSIFPNNACRAA